MSKMVNRRKFLKLGTQTLASSTLLSTLGMMERALAASDYSTGYRALVCVFLHGGNDCFNWIVPSDSAGYATYQAARRTLALARNSLLPITPTNVGSAQYGLHPKCPGIRSLFESDRAAFIGNVGTLVTPTTATQFRNESVPLPPYLFSHSDQIAQWMTSYPQSRLGHGWAGRVSDLLQDQAYQPQLALNVSLDGNNIWQSGADTVQYTLATDGAPEFNAVADSGYRGGTRRTAFLDLLQQAGGDASSLTRELARTETRSKDLARFVNDSLATVVPLRTVFPTGPLGAQLRMAARMVSARAAIGASRQMFFISLGAWDTHDRQLVDHADRLEILDAGLKAFQDALVEIGAQNLVTTFTASDFGRTLTSNGDGSDHGWGGHALVMGGAVSGRKIYGTMPNLTINGPDDVGEGRIVPTTGTDQYAATLARWFGVSDSDLDIVFPNLRNFGSRNLGFLA